MTATDRAYREILARKLPHAIHTADEHEHYLKQVSEMMSRHRSKAESRYLELLSIIIERYEQEIEPIEAPDPVVALKELMDANGVTQAELSKIVGSSGLASMILSGQRPISKAQAKMFAERFNVSPALFI